MWFQKKNIKNKNIVKKNIVKKNVLIRYFEQVPEVVFISGGASGIGAYLATAFANAGAKIAIFDLSPESETLKHSYSPVSQSIKHYKTDISDAGNVEENIRQAVNDLGPPQLAINCAGILRTAPFTKLDYATFKLVIDVNLMGSRNFAASVTPWLRSGSQLALVASLAGVVGTYTQAAYAASKFGVVGLAEVLRLELKTAGIAVSVICPGEIETPLLSHERLHGSAITKEMNRFAGVLSVEQACTSILKGLAQKQFMITPGVKAWFTREFSKKASGLFRKVADLKYQQLS